MRSSPCHQGRTAGVRSVRSWVPFLMSRSSGMRTMPFITARAPREARALWGAIADRFAACKLVLHPQKTKIVYCKDVNRRGRIWICRGAAIRRWPRLSRGRVLRSVSIPIREFA